MLRASIINLCFSEHAPSGKFYPSGALAEMLVTYTFLQLRACAQSPTYAFWSLLRTACLPIGSMRGNTNIGWLTHAPSSQKWYKNIARNLSKIGSAASEEKSFENVNGQTDDGQKVITIAHPRHSLGELKSKNKRAMMAL